MAALKSVKTPPFSIPLLHPLIAQFKLLNAITTIREEGGGREKKKKKIKAVPEK